MPNEILEQLVRILLCHDQSSSLYNIAYVLDEILATRREFVNIKERVVSNVFESFVDLGVVGKTTLTEGFDDAVEAELRRRSALQLLQKTLAGARRSTFFLSVT